MPDEQPNPVTAHLLNMIQGRQQAEVAKLTILGQMLQKMDEQLAAIATIAKQLDELIERTKGK